MIWKLSKQSGRYGAPGGRYGALALALVGALALALFPSLPGGAQVAPTPNVANTPIGEVNIEGLRPTYTACSAQTVTATGELALLQGSATRTVRVTGATIWGSATAASSASGAVARRSSAPTGGTLGTSDPVLKHDTNDPAPTAVYTSYTTPPTTGTNAGVAGRGSVLYGAAGTYSPSVQFQFATNGEKSLVLRGTSDWAVANVGTGAAAAGNVNNVCFTWIEE
jgi:hypothetical protein